VVKQQVEHQLAGGIAGLVVAGSTGEFGNLRLAERLDLLEHVVAAVDGRVPVWCTVGGMGTAEVIDAAVLTQRSGADALMVLQPLYMDVADAEILAHFRAVRERVDIPVIAYNIPLRTPRGLTVEAIGQLADEGVLAGIKDSSGDHTLGRQLVERTRDIEGFSAFAGGETTIDLVRTIGFDGCVPGTANILPEPAVHLFSGPRDEALDRIAVDACNLLGDMFYHPLRDASFQSQVVASLRVATSHVLGLELPASLPPLTRPDTQYIDSIIQIVTAAQSSWRDHVGIAEKV
jgi:4-hydroxy-tetrahydrodipicolinate synthase